MVVAVPISKMMIGASYCAQAATAPATKSAPSCAGLSIRMFNPVFSPAPTKTGVFPVTFSTARFIPWDKDGTTEEQIAEIAQYFGGKYHLLRTFPINENLPEDDLKRLEKVRDYKFPTIAAMTIGLDMTVEKGKEVFEALE